MAPVKLNRCVVLFDLKSNNVLQLRAALLKMFSVFFFDKCQHAYNFVLVNSEKTRNRKNFKHIYEVNTEEMEYDPLFIYEKIEAKSSDGASWKEAVGVALQILKDNTRRKIITHQIIFFTDLTSSAASAVSLESIKRELTNWNIFFHVVGPEVKLHQSITSYNDIGRAMNDLEIVKENKNVEEIKMLLDSDTKVIISDVKMGVQLFASYVNPQGKQPWYTPLTIGTKLDLKITTTKLIENYAGVFLKPEHGTAGVPTLFVSMEDSTKTYQFPEVKSGIARHGKFIHIPNNKMFKERTDRCFSLMFITPIESIPEYMITGPGCNTVKSNDSASPEAFDCLLSRLDARKCCLIAKKVYLKGNKPIYMALIPNIEEKCFRAAQLAYCHEVPFEWPEQKPTFKEVSKEVSNYLESITVNSPKFELNCLLTPNVTISAGNKKLLNLAVSKLLREKIDFSQVDYDVFRTSINSGIGEDLRKAWPSRNVSTEMDPEIEQSDGSDYDDDYF